jgi:capsular exopolysaccharide synthesis family protein
MTPAFVLFALHRWWLVATSAGVLLAAAAIALVWALFEPQYEAAAWFKIEERTPFLAFETRGEDRSKAFFQTQIELIRSPLVLGSVVKRPEIAALPDLEKTPDSIKWLAKEVKVSSVGESELFKIAFTSSKPENATQIANAIAEAYFKLRDMSESERNQRVIQLLEKEQINRSKEVVRLRQDLRELAKQVTGSDAILSKSDNDSSKKNNNAVMDLQTRLITAQVEIAVLEARVQAADDDLKSRQGNLANRQKDAGDKGQEGTLSKQELALRDIMVDKLLEDRPEVVKRVAAIQAQEANLQELESKLLRAKQDPSYLQAARELARDKDTLEKLRKDLRARTEKEATLTLLTRRTEQETLHVDKQLEEAARLRVELKGRRIMEQRLADEYAKEVKRAQRNNGDTLELEFKRAELVRAEKVFELMAQRALELQTERGAPNRISLLQLAEAPQGPVEAIPLKKMLMAGLAGFFLPFGLAVGWERLARRVNNLTDLEQESQIAVLGEVAKFPLQMRPSPRISNPQPNADMQVFEESIDTLRTNIVLSEDLQGVRVLAVTSATQHEGKTSVASQLALSLARGSGELVLLIDADMRSPDVHRVFQVPLKPGLAGVLKQECTLDSAIVKDAMKLVHILPAGQLSHNPYRLLANGAWEAFLASIPAEYRFVVVDTPPVLAANETLALARGADAALICAMRAFSRSDQVRLVLDRFAASGIRPAGMVLNGVPLRSYTYRYGRYAQEQES